MYPACLHHVHAILLHMGSYHIVVCECAALNNQARGLVENGDDDDAERGAVGGPACIASASLLNVQKAGTGRRRPSRRATAAAAACLPRTSTATATSSTFPVRLCSSVFPLPALPAVVVDEGGCLDGNGAKKDDEHRNRCTLRIVPPTTVTGFAVNSPTADAAFGASPPVASIIA